MLLGDVGVEWVRLKAQEKKSTEKGNMYHGVQKKLTYHGDGLMRF